MVAKKAYLPERGDIVWLTFNPRSGHEQAGRCPALVLSPATYNGKVGLALLCSITSQITGYPFEVMIPTSLPLSGVSLADQIKSLDWRARDAELVCALPAKIVNDVLQKLVTLLG